MARRILGVYMRSSQTSPAACLWTKRGHKHIASFVFPLWSGYYLGRATLTQPYKHFVLHNKRIRVCTGNHGRDESVEEGSEYGEKKRAATLVADTYIKKRRDDEGGNWRAEGAFR